MYSPLIDVCERANEIVILIELPGVDRRDIQITWKGNQLTISGNKRRSPDGAVRYLCIERSYGPFRSDISINVPIDHKKAKAELRNGLMKIHLPKVSEEKARNTIPIE